MRGEVRSPNNSKNLIMVTSIGAVIVIAIAIMCVAVAGPGPVHIPSFNPHSNPVRWVL